MTHRRSVDRWATRLGVILAVAGSAVGLGNFLKFPTLVAQYGGGAFLVPYFCAMLLLGIPLAWVEWSMGRLGGSKHGRHSLPGIYDALSGGRRWLKYLGVLGLFVPFVIVVYYTYIESWLLGYSVFAAIGKFANIENTDGFGAFLGTYLGNGDGPTSAPSWAILFLVITLVANFYVIWRGVSKGIEKLARIAMPLLFIMAVVLVVRVLTLPDALDGLKFMWTPRFDQLGNAEVWLAAAGQVFFTLSLGLGAIITYSSYLKRDEDVARSGMSAAGINQFTEVILGGSLAIPAAVAIFGVMQAQDIAQNSGVVGLAVITMPAIFNHMPAGQLLSVLWFLLLFIAGITSSVSLLQTIVAFLQDELGWTRTRATMLLAGVTALYLIPVALWNVFIDDMDFWTNKILMPLGALAEVLVFAFVLGIAKGWDELKRGATMRVPIVFKYIITFVTPLYLVIILGAFFIQDWQNGWPSFGLPDGPNAPYVLASRLVLLALFLGMLALVKIAWSRPRPDLEDDLPVTERAEPPVEANL